MNRLSLPIGKLREHYDVVVVGSGYGGGIAASRLARAGLKVCVLERGREWLPGEFPDTEPEALEQMQANVCGSHVGRQTGLYDFHVDDDINVFKGCGLGGTSLVNANVVLEAEPKVLEDPRWPAAIRADRETRLADGYRRAREMLGPSPYPETWPELAKLQAQQRSAEHLGEPFVRVPLAVTFEAGQNPAGVRQEACTLCGDCVSGCNVSAKNTVAMNYLPDAHNHGAEIFTEVAVRSIERRAGRWLVIYRPSSAGREMFPDSPDPFVTGDIVVLAAGALGSTEILLRSKSRGLPMSDCLGRAFTGNGDVLAFGYNNDHPANAVGLGTRDARGRDAVGPCITSAVDVRQRETLADGMIIEEGVVPGALSNFLTKALVVAAKKSGRDSDSGVYDFVREVGRELESLVRGPYHGAVKNTMTYLVMTHDDSKGVMELENDRLRLRWPGAASQKIFQRVDEALFRVVQANGGTLVPNPLWSSYVKKQLITVHPLGGCPMAEDAAHGVTNHKGQVFSGPAGTGVHAGLYVADGSVLPTPVGVNPLLTISALAERNMALLAADRGLVIDYTLPSKRRARPAVEPVGIRFTERMSGWFSNKVQETHFEQAAALARNEGSSMSFVLTLAARDLTAMLEDERHRMDLSGTLVAPALADGPMAVSSGEFQLLSVDPQRANTKNMVYRMMVVSAQGASFYFHGFKVVRDDWGPDLWRDTTRLFVTVHRDDERGAIVGRGLLTISPEDFARQLTTMDVTGPATPAERLRAVSRFGTFFTGSLFHTYGGVALGTGPLAPGAPPRKRRPLAVPTPEVHPFQTSDAQRLLLTRYRGGEKGPVLLSHGLGVSSRIFSTDTIDTNLLEYLVANGYDVWLLDSRVSIELPASHRPSTGDDLARIDYPEAVARLLAITGAQSVQMVVHCYGATTFFMAMLAGLQGVRSAVVSQIAAHVDAAPAVALKSGLHVPDALAAIGVESLDTSSDPDLWNRLFDKAVALQPQPREERCDSSVCHRISFFYSLLYEHDQLTPLTHGTLHELFGEANIAAFRHLGVMVRKGHLVDAGGKDVYMPHVGRLKLPLCFIHGAENACYLPRSTERTFDWLRAHNGSHFYERHVIANHGHIDCIFGKDAATAVYPLVLAHLEKYARSGAR